jgi:predicted histone-like DNA-binding protein
MSIIYKVIQRINPRNPQAPKKFYAQAVRGKKLNIKQISKKISEKTLVNHVDVQAVVLALVDVTMAELQESNAVQLGDLGTLSVSLSSEGAETEAKFTPSMIKKSRINYRPGSELTGTVKAMKYVKQA